MKLNDVERKRAANLEYLRLRIFAILNRKVYRADKFPHFIKCSRKSNLSFQYYYD